MSKMTKGNSKPKWIDSPSGVSYFPSRNIPPTKYTPVLYTKPIKEEEVNHVSSIFQSNYLIIFPTCQSEKEIDTAVVQPMMWGLVPSWFKGSDPKAHGLSTNNARLEGISSAKVGFKILKLYVARRALEPL